MKRLPCLESRGKITSIKTKLKTYAMLFLVLMNTMYTVHNRQSSFFILLEYDKYYFLLFFGLFVNMLLLLLFSLLINVTNFLIYLILNFFVLFMNIIFIIVGIIYFYHLCLDFIVIIHDCLDFIIKFFLSSLFHL